MLGKIVLVALIALGASLYFPQSRPTVLEYAAPLMDPFLGWASRGELDQIGKDLVNHERTYYQFPANQSEFLTWMRSRYQVEGSTIDGWGLNYVVQSWPDSFAVKSAGPDNELGTDDDLRVVGPRLRALQRRR